MDKIVHAAVDVICSHGTTGVSLSLLWRQLHAPLSSENLPLCSAVKRAVLSGLSAVPGLRFETLTGSEFDPKSKPVEELEFLDLKVFADEKLRRCFVGLYDVKSSHITPPQQRVLELLALARGNGVTQNQLCKEVGMAANNFFYVVKRLESWGLVVRHSTIVRTKEASSDKEPKNSQPVHTNLVRLQRYAPSLSSQQRLEITKESNDLEENHGDDAAGTEAVLDEGGQDGMLVKDFLPALKAICDRLEQAEGKVLVVADIKKELGYRETRGHRAWRNLRNRLEPAGLVEFFEANVGNQVESPSNPKKSKSSRPKKPVTCMRLLKKFSPKLFEQKTPDCEDDKLASDQHIASGKQVQNTDHLVEVPLEQQIVDMIDAEGPKGLLGVEVCKRLGISNKMLDNLCNAIVPRFGLHQLSENRNRGSAYRFWTRGNFCPNLPNSSFNILEDGALSLCRTEEPTQGEKSSTSNTSVDDLNSQGWLIAENTQKGVSVEKVTCGSQEDKGSDEMVISAGGSDEAAHRMSIISADTVGGAQSNSIVEVPSNPMPKLQQGQRYPSLTSATRELRILEKLETEKIIIKPELHRWLESMEGNQSKMDKKTLQRCLKNLKLAGHCKLMDFSVPGVSNCGRHREIRVVVHPSIKGSASELSEQVHEKFRSFELHIRSGASPVKKQFPFPVPVLHGIERIQMNSSTEAGSIKAEAMRANGFVLAKMVRAKLLHCFLWDYVNNSASCIDGSTSINHVNTPSNSHSSWFLFSLDSAIKAMPLELFLQVVGSALKWKDMIEKCKNGLLLSDFRDEEYKSLMDTRATSRLSWIIDLLRRLKLIKLVADESLKDAVQLSHATLVYALELKPYIEEPPSIEPFPGCRASVDLRPHFRHDFVLSSTEALEKYWQTLEYCYAAADPKAAVHAFPGSVAYEVCLYRSWTTVRVMKAEQRADLIKRIKDQGSKKLTFKECRGIAKELNLTLEQVLRVYYDERQRRLDRFQSDSNVQVLRSNRRSDRPRSQRKRKRGSEGSSMTDVTADLPSESLEAEEDEQEQEQEQEQEESLAGHCMRPILKQTRQPKFLWTEEADRQLIIQYARQKAIQGARPGTEWSAISNLPTDSSRCGKRLASLKNDVFRKSLMRLCNLLTQRYAQHLRREKTSKPDDNSEELNSEINRWDDFEDSKIKQALHEVLKQIKASSSKKTESASQVHHIPIESARSELENDSEKQPTSSTRKSRRERLSQKFVKHLKEGISVNGRINQSLAASSAVELFKLAFLTNSKSVDMPNLLADTLHCYSEHDLYSAFDYLRQKKIMIGSGPPFFLSQIFIKNLSLSQFPANTGKRAARFAKWIHEKEENLMEGVVNLPPDVQCGDIFQLFALVSSGELSISPVLPDEGVGETEDSRNSKRKNDGEYDNYSDSKKHKCQSLLYDSELYSRREKGFPGITVSLGRSTIRRPEIVEFFKDDDRNLLFSKNDHFYASLGQKSGSKKPSIDYVKEAPDFGSIPPSKIISGDSIWEVMTNHAIQNWSSHPRRENITELIKSAYVDIQKAGDQGLSMSKISEVIGIEDTILSEHLVNVLELYGFVLKVNGYDYVHIVDSLYRDKYFLTSKTTCSQDSERTLFSIPQRVDDATNVVKEGINNAHEVNCSNTDNVHKVTILNLSDDSPQLSNTAKAPDNLEGCSQTSTTSAGGSQNNKSFDVITACQPILPWINADGTVNGIVYRGLTRRVLGIVTQNPGILEDGILGQMEVLNPQSCRRLLELMVLDKHLSVRKMCQRTSAATPPALLGGLLGNRLSKPKYVCREHYFANPMSSTLL